MGVAPVESENKDVFAFEFQKSKAEIFGRICDEEDFVFYHSHLT